MLDYQRGNMEAFERLYAVLAPPLRRYLAYRVRDSALTDDLLQETFLQIHRARHTFDPEFPLEPWAYAIAHNVHAMDRRAWARRGRLEVSPIDGAAEPSLPDHEAELAARQQLGRALAELTPQRRQAWLLRNFWGLSFREIGVQLGIRSGAAKLRAGRGMAALRAVLKGKPRP